MKLTTLVTREILERKASFVTALLSVVAGVALVVALRGVMQASEADVARKLDGLGANVLVLPEATAVSDYFSADLSGSVMPESWVARIALSDLKGLENVSPKLSRPVDFRGQVVTMTGILPQREFAAKASWKGAGVFGRPKSECAPDSETVPSALRETAIRRRVIETLAADEVLLGSDLARRFQLGAEATFEIDDRRFKVVEVLPETGTIDDTRIFAHLHTVQDMAGAGAVVNAIEIVGCCREISRGLTDGLRELLPEARVVTVTQIVSTQLETNRTMAGLSWMIFAVALLVGGIGIFVSMTNNLRERRAELGILGALGGGAALFFKLFLTKALVVALLGGFLGWAAGALAASGLGPTWVGVEVSWRWDLLPTALVLALGLTALAGIWPLWRAARLDPAEALRDA